MEQYSLKNVNNFLNTNIYSYLETSGGQSSKSIFKCSSFFQHQCELDICGSLRLIFLQWCHVCSSVVQCQQALSSKLGQEEAASFGISFFSELNLNQGYVFWGKNYIGLMRDLAAVEQMSIELMSRHHRCALRIIYMFVKNCPI